MSIQYDIGVFLSTDSNAFARGKSFEDLPGKITKN